MKGVAASEIGLEAGPSEDVGCFAKGPASPKAQSSNKGPNYSKGCPQQPDIDGKLREGPISSAAQAQNNLQEMGFLLKCFASSTGNPPESEPFVARESEI